MSDDNVDDEELTPAEYRPMISDAQFDIDAKRTALNVLDRAAELDELRHSSVVCEDQADALREAAEAAERAADALWPGEGDIPDLEQFIEESDAIVTDGDEEG